MKVGEFFDKLAGAELDTPKDTVTTAPKQSRQVEIKIPRLPVTRIVLFAVIVGASFYFGVAYQKSKQPTAQTLGSSGSSQSNTPQSGGFGSGNGGGFGAYRRNLTPATVTAVSTSSISVKDSSGNTTTYSITSSTVITDNGQTADSSSINVGDSVIVIPNRTDPTSARRIIDNPSTGSSPQPSSGDPGTSQLN